MGADAGQARVLLQALYAALPTAARAWSLDAPVCCQLSGLVYERISALLELPRPRGIDGRAPERPVAPPRGEVAARLLAVPAELRLFYLLDIFFRCPSATLAALTGWSEADVRAARARVAWALVDGEAR